MVGICFTVCFYIEQLKTLINFGPMNNNNNNKELWAFAKDRLGPIPPYMTEIQTPILPILSTTGSFLPNYICFIECAEAMLNLAKFL
jgi:hypothetical protein